MDKISIILPCYNVEEYLSRCINSLLNQSYQNIEIIIIDDGSQDNTLKVAYDLLKLDNRIIVLNQENRGVSYARNRGIDKSTGNYIIFVDPDDYVHEDFVKTLHDRLIVTKSDMTICGHTKVYDDGRLVKSNSSREIFKAENIFKEYFLGTSTLTVLMCDKIFKADIIKKNNIECPEEVTSGQDQVFILEYLIFCKSVATVDTNHYFYYQRTGSKSKRYEYYIFEKTITKLDCMKKILIDSNNYQRYKNYYNIRLYMNLFSQGFLLFTYNYDTNFKQTFYRLRTDSLKYIDKNKFAILTDILFYTKLNFKERIACLVIYFFPVNFVIKLYKKYTQMKEVGR